MPNGLTGMIDHAAALVQSSRHVVAFSGAGLSVESGIPPYRGPGGLWTKHGQPPLLSYKQFAQDPKGWWESRLSAETESGNPIYEMKLAVDRASPNPGHLALAELEGRGLLRCVITQNVDNLHHEAGSRALLEIHGNRTRLRCLQCGKRCPRDGFPLSELPPRCPECDGLLKMDTVMFGEKIPPDMLQACWTETRACDCMLLIGASGMVNPAAQMPVVAHQNGATLIEINISETPLTRLCHVTLSGPSGEVLPLLVDRIQSIC